MHFPSLSAHFSNRTAVLYCTELVGLSFIWPSDVAVRVIMALSRPPLLALYMPILLMIVPSFIAPPTLSSSLGKILFLFPGTKPAISNVALRDERGLCHSIRFSFYLFSLAPSFHLSLFFFFFWNSFFYLFIFIFSSFNPYSVPPFCVSFRSH